MRHLVHILLAIALLVPTSVAPTHAQGRGEPPQRPRTNPEQAPGIEMPVAAPAESSDASPKASSTEINVKNAEIAAVVRLISKRTKRNYILDERVKGKVSIYLPSRITDGDSIKILDSVLGLKGFTAVPVGENLWKIVPSKEAKQSTIPTLREGEQTPGSSVVTKIVNLKYISADEVKEVITPLVSPDGLVNSYAGTNSLLLIDYEDNLHRLQTIVESLDVPFTNRDMTLIPVTNADAEDIAKKLQEILGIGDEAGKGDAAGVDSVRARMNLSQTNQARDLAQNTGVGGAPASMGGQIAPAGVQQGRGREPKIIPDARTNSIIVVADDDTTARIRALVSQLDSPIDLSGFRFYVYRCQHASAEELAEVLSGLAGGGGSSSSGSRANAFGDSEEGGGLGLNTNSRNRGNKSQRTQDRVSGQSRTPGRSRSESGSGTGGPASVSLGENISITADKATNSLVIFSSKADYEKVRSLLEQIDIKRRQVLVEAMILEVGVDDSLELGTDWLTSTGGKDGGIFARQDFGPSQDSLAELLRNPTQTSKLSVAAASAGTLTLPGGIKVPTQAILLTAAQANQNVNVLSAPNILTTDNEQAEIVVGQNVPFVASRSTDDTNLNNTFNQIDRQDVGITLRITPQISSKEFVTLQLFTEVSNVVAATLASELGPTTTVRTSETTVISKDGQMIVIGGLLSDDVSEQSTGVPFLKDVPVLGSLFETATTARRKTNLLILITPRIVKDQFDARDTTLDHRDRLQGDIRSRALDPDRREILNSERLDRVTEAELSQDPKPSTMKGRDAEREGTMSPPTLSRDTLTDSKGVIELKVAPKLPSIPGPSNSESRSSLKPSALKSSEIPGPTPSGGRFVVMEISDGRIGPHLPFSVDKKTFSFGVEIPVESAPRASSFFAAGKGILYGNPSDPAPMTSLGAFPTKEAADKFFSDREIPWYTLSPYEIMNLGKGPWTPGTVNSEKAAP